MSEQKTKKMDDPEYFKKYYINHKEKYVHKRKRCEACACDVMLSDFTRHCKSKKHIKNSLKPL